MRGWLTALAAAALLAAGTAKTAAAQVRGAGVPILMYHRVDGLVPRDAVGRSLTLEPAKFEASLAWLRQHGLHTLTTVELVEALKRSEHPASAVVLSFDDGYEDAFTTVLPLLKRYGARASFYVSADLIGTPRHLTWRELRAMRDEGLEIGCHGSRHLDLTVISRTQKRYEIGHCAAALARYVGVPRTYAYAAGRYDAAAMEIVRASGFEAALTERAGTVTSVSDPLELPRRRVDRDSSIAAFAELVSGK
jgi:peptidoglycan/xylan/chitin deacetylase (PgdA/CDA1 family)